MAGDLNQWIRKPQGLGLLGQQIFAEQSTEDPQLVLKQCGPREIGILVESLRLWARSIEELLVKLRDTVPDEGMLAEVHYWRDMARVLEAISGELKQGFVEMVVQLVALSEDQSGVLSEFQAQKARVAKGSKEAKWNNKYMKIVEKPVSAIEMASELKPVQVNVGVLLKTLRHVYDNSNFYREARIVSFIDRLLECVVAKLKMHISLRRSVMAGA